MERLRAKKLEKRLATVAELAPSKESLNLIGASFIRHFATLMGGSPEAITDNFDVKPFKETLTEEKKHELLDAPINGMLTLGARLDIPLPAQNELFNRLVFLSTDDYAVLSGLVTGESDEKTWGTELPNRLCLINTESIMTNDQAISTAILQSAAIHELWHSVGYHELYVPRDLEEDSWKLRPHYREGLMVVVPRDEETNSAPVIEGLQLLNEGFNQYLTNESLKIAHLSRIRFYWHEREMIKLLIDPTRIGIDAFLQAKFRKEGISHLSNVMNNRFKREPGERPILTQVTKLLTNEHNQHPRDERIYELHPYFPSTISFIQQRTAA